MAYVEELSGSKLKSKLGSTLNEAVAMGPNRFAQSQLERMGWSSGEGLGKNRQGIQTHVRIQLRDEQAGLGHASSTKDNHGWWNDSMGKIFSKLQQTTTTKDGKTKKLTKKTKKKKKKEKLITSSSVSTNPITDEDLFRATGGKRFGMRAQRKQIGKWARTESNLSTQEEEEVKKKLEWNGRGQATVVLSSNQQSTATTESSTTIHDNQNNHDPMTLSREDCHNPTMTRKQEKKKARRKQKVMEQKENSSSDRPKKEKKRKRDATEN